MPKLKHLRQHHRTACVCTCMAMMANYHGLDVTQQEIEHEFDLLGVGTGYEDEKIVWARLGFIVEEFVGLMPEVVMLATVPSLNIMAVNHRIVIDLHDEHRVLDPQEGNEGKAFYTYDMLKGWSELITVRNVGCFRKHDPVNTC